VGETKLPADTVSKIFGALSVRQSELENYWQIEPFSPLKRAPIVPFDDRYALPSPALFLPAVQTLFEQAFKGTAQWETYQQHRAAYAVRRGVDLFKRVLPGAQIYAGMKYRSAGVEGDVDILVIFEGRVFLVEVKSGDFAEAARAGIESRVQTDLEELVLKAHRQSNRAMDYIESADVVAFGDGMTRLDLRRADYSKFHLMSLTLEQLGHVVNTARAYLQKTSRTAWTVSVDDLEVVVDILARPAQFIEYVECRDELLNMTQVQNVDELGFLEAYIANGLQVDTSQFGIYDNVLMEADSKKIDEFEHAKGRGVTLERPERKLPDEVVEVLDQLASRRPAGWLDASLRLLRMIPRHQRLVSRNIQKLHAGKRIKGLIERRGDDSLIASIRLDDPRLGREDGTGPLLVINASLSTLEVKMGEA
jgi:Holliday junction resolvase-like predicted endonuclease